MEHQKYSEELEDMIVKSDEWWERLDPCFEEEYEEECEDE